MTRPEDAPPTLAFSFPRGQAPDAAHYLSVALGGARRFVPLSREPVVLGRDPGCDVQVADAGVSREHCDVRLVGAMVVVRDLGSKNGTFVDGVPITQAQVLPPSSQLQVGNHAFRHELLSPAEVARQEALASELDRARRYVEELIPAPLVEGPLRVEWCFVPSEVVGGDALGYHERSPGRFAFYAIDVCGHGVGSAMHAASILNVLRGETLPATDFDEPAQVLQRLNAIFPMDDHGGMFFTAWYGLVDVADQSLCFASAGHPPAIRIDGEGRIVDELGRQNPPVGAVPGHRFVQGEVDFEPGDDLLVFSDGAYELVDRQGQRRGLKEFEALLLELVGADRARGLPARVHAAVSDVAGRVLLEDDFSLLRIFYPRGG